MQISIHVILPVVASTALIFFFLISLAVRAQRKKAVTGLEGMIGLVGEVTVPLPHGKILVEGEIWDAVSEASVEKGEKVRIVSVEGLMVTVEKI
jgi:membrane-bound serine protease (ClpP class)